MKFYPSVVVKYWNERCSKRAAHISALTSQSINACVLYMHAKPFWISIYGWNVDALNLFIMVSPFKYKLLNCQKSQHKSLLFNAIPNSFWEVYRKHWFLLRTQLRECQTPLLSCPVWKKPNLMTQAQPLFIILIESRLPYLCMLLADKGWGGFWICWCFYVDGLWKNAPIFHARYSKLWYSPLYILLTFQWKIRQTSAFHHWYMKNFKSTFCGFISE